MSNRYVMTDQEVADMQRRIDKGILLAHQRLIARAQREGYSLVVYRSGRVCDIPGTEF